MGRKTLVVCIAVGTLGAMVSMLSLLLPFHKQMWVAAGFVPVLISTTYPLGASIDIAGPFPCSFVKTKTDTDFCDKVEGSRDLYRMQEIFCADLISLFFPEACLGMSWAYAIGLAYVLVEVANIMLFASSCFLLHQYLTVAPKKKYRDVSFLLLFIGCLLNVLVLLLYILPIYYLDNVVPSFVLVHNVLSTSSGWGMGKGYIFSWVGVIIQIVSTILCRSSESGEELRLLDAREHDLFMQDQMYGSSETTVEKAPWG